MKEMRKGISPLIATVLLIAFTVGVAGILSMWITSFTQDTTEAIGGQTTNQMYCAYAAIRLTDLQYCNQQLSGIVENAGNVDIGNVTLQIIFRNSTPAQTIYLSQGGGERTINSELSLRPTFLASFNVTIGGSNYNKIHVFTNCSNAFDDASASSVTTTC